MYRILRREQLTTNIVLLEIEAPWIAHTAEPGKFIIVIPDANGERIPLTIVDINRAKSSVSIVFQIVGDTTCKLSEMEEGESLYAIVGPLGRPAEIIVRSKDRINERMKILFVAGGVGVAPIYPQAQWVMETEHTCEVVIGARNKDLIFFEEQMRQVCQHLYIVTDDGSKGEKGLVTDKIRQLLDNGNHYDYCVAIGPIPMMKYVSALTKEYNLPTIVSMNPMMVDGTGMCGACRITVDNQVRFTCVDGPEFDGHLVDFDQAMRRLARPDMTRYPVAVSDSRHQCRLATPVEQQLREIRQRPNELSPEERIHTFDEVSKGFSLQQAQQEASRCLRCRKPQCVEHCPVSIQIPDFIAAVADGDIAKAGKILTADTSLPAVCGRVCPQERQCEGACIRGRKDESIAIGGLERFVADWCRDNHIQHTQKESQPKNGHKVAIIGSGPSGLSCAGDLIKQGFDVTIYEALHRAGGVLIYGIPEFRLPKKRVVEPEIENLRRQGVEIVTNVIVGKSISIDSLLHEEGYDAVYIASGAGLPKYMGIPGEMLIGVVSANELLTRTNLMHGYDTEYDTPIYLGRRVAVIGGGNVAMDAARTARRLGSEVTVIYRRSEEDMPARKEEVHHAKEEGINFVFRTNPIAIEDDGHGNVGAIRCIKMAMGEADESGKHSFQPIEGSEYSIEVDNVVVALGTSPNPLIKNTTAGLETDTKGCIVVDERGETTCKRIYAGGDAVSGTATVILAMGAGRRAAKAIAEQILAQ